MAGTAPEKFAQWLASHRHVDPRFRYVYQYHPRSDAHSIALCKLLLEDLLERCDDLRLHASSDRIVYGINYPHVWPRSGKRKNIDLAVGTTEDFTTSERLGGAIREGRISRVLISCEAKTVMTEHSKSQPRPKFPLETAGF